MRRKCGANANSLQTPMPNLDFYATGKDHETVLDLVFSTKAFKVFESYSRFDREIVEFHSTEQFRSYFDSERPEEKCLILLQLFALNGGGEPLFHRIELKPRAVRGATFRFACEGWGLIQLQLGGMRKGRLSRSHTNHNSEKRAYTWEDVGDGRLGSPSAWNWQEITRASRRLNSAIRRLAVDKTSSRPILPEALTLREQGIPFGE